MNFPKAIIENLKLPPTNKWLRKMHCRYLVIASMEFPSMRDARCVEDFLVNARFDVDQQTMVL